MTVADEPPFGTLLKRFRRLRHLTQQDLADRAGYSFHYISMLERGVRSPLPLTIDVLADALGLATSDRVALHAATPQDRHAAAQEVPAPVTPLIGRHREKEWIVTLLQRPDVRILTVTGPGGVGKTRLIEHVMAALAHVFSGGTAFVDLAVVQDPDGVIPAIARALNLRAMGGQPLLERLIEFLREREMLVVLDSMERVLRAAATILDLLGGCPNVKVLTTSRAPLHLSSEQEFPLQPLALPDPTGTHPSALTEYPSVALFIQRARLVKPTLQIGEKEIAMIADICRRLDGLPLGIELAAARVAHLPLPALRDRLEHRLQILTGGPQDLPDRQQRMRDTIAWSYNLLPPAETALFRQLSVFVGSWSLDAAETVCAVEPAATPVLDGLRSLVSSSLIVPVDTAEDEPRYRMLDTIREYAVEQRTSAGEGETVSMRHAEYYTHLAEQAEPALQGRDQDIWYPRLERDHDNLRAALAWLLQTGNPDGALRLAGSVWRFWQRHGDFQEGRRWLEAGLVGGEHVPVGVRAKALWGASWLAYHQGDYERMRSLSDAHLALTHESGDRLGMRNALTGLGMAALAEGRYADATPLLQRALDVCTPLGKIWHRATSLLNLGTAITYLGDYGRANDLFEQALSLYRERGDEVFAARVLQHLGYLALLQDDQARAGMLFEQSLRTFSDLGEKLGVADGLESMAAVRAASGEAEQVARLVGGAAALRDRLAVPPPPFLRAIWQPYVTRAAERLGEADWTAAREEGRAMSLEEVIASTFGESS